MAQTLDDLFARVEALQLDHVATAGALLLQHLVPDARSAAVLRGALVSLIALRGEPCVQACNTALQTLQRPRPQGTTAVQSPAPLLEEDRSIGEERALGIVDTAPPLRNDEVELVVPRGPLQPTREKESAGDERALGPVDAAPPLRNDEVEIVVPDVENFKNGLHVESTVKAVGDFTFFLRVFPKGFGGDSGVDARVMPSPGGGWRTGHELDDRRIDLKCEITLTNWFDYRECVTKQESGTCSKHIPSLGGKMLGLSDLTRSSGWLSPDGALRLRARCWV